MAKRILTIDDLYKFFVEQDKNVNFSVKDTRTPIIVSVPGTFAKEEDDMPGLLKLKLKVCHTDLNRNGSFISKENMEKSMPTLKYRPILAHIHELEDGTKDFYAHNMEIVENEDGEAEINYIEKQVGCFTADEPWLEYDEKMDKTYVMAYSVIPEAYTEAADIIRRKKGTKVSCELVINELSYNAKEKYLDLTDFYFSGTTLLGCDEFGNEIGEGMLGSRADIADFCHKEPILTYQDKLIETLNKLNVTLEGFNKNSKEGGDAEMNNVDNEVIEEVEIEVEETSIEETSVEDEVVVVEEEIEVEETEIEEPSTSEDGDEVQEEPAEVVAEENFTKTFTVELSHEDIHCALYRLIGQYEEEDNEYYYIRNVYDDNFIMQGWAYGRLYKVGYEVDGENVSLKGERQEVFELIVTESEKIAIEKMREDYAELKAFKENYEAAEIAAKKDEIFAKKSYEKLADVKEFKELKQNAVNFTVEEVCEKAKLIYADFMEQNEDHEEVKSVKVMGYNFNKKEAKKSPYGNLFNKG
jgi:hypothetical protein